MTDTQFELLMQEIKKNSKDIAEIKQQINGNNQEIRSTKQQINGITQQINGITQQINGITQQINEINQQINGIKRDIAEIKQEQFAMKKMSFKNNLDLNKKIDDYMEINSRQYHQIEDLLEKKYQESLNDRREIHEDINNLHALIKMYHGETA